MRVQLGRAALSNAPYRAQRGSRTRARSANVDAQPPAVAFVCPRLPRRAVAGARARAVARGGVRVLRDVSRRPREAALRGLLETVQVNDVPLAAPRDERCELEVAQPAGGQREMQMRAQHAVVAELVTL